MLFNFFINLINLLIKGIGAILKFIVSILPNSPFVAISNSGINLDSFSWIIPVAQILAILQAWLVAVSIYYIYMVAMKWIKLI